MTTGILPRLLGNEIYQQFEDPNSNPVTLTYHDLWLIIICRTSLDGDWHKLLQVADRAAAANHKRMLVQRLWELDLMLGGLPEIPPHVQSLHIHRAHYWFKHHPVNSENTP